jgi:hypothetical protein
VNRAENITINVELTERQAFSFAQFLKRAAFVDFRSNAVDDDEAYAMLSAGEEICDALAKQGVAPK